jgi:hypothetical protein
VKAEMGIIDVSTDQGILKNGSKPPEAGKMRGADFPSQPSEGNNPTNTFISDCYDL